MKSIRIYLPAFLFLLVSAVFSQQASAQQVEDECRTYHISCGAFGVGHDDVLERAIACYHEEVQEYLDAAKLFGLTVHGHLDFDWYVAEPNILREFPPRWFAFVENDITICGPPFMLDLFDDLVDP